MKENFKEDWSSSLVFKNKAIAVFFDWKALSLTVLNFYFKSHYFIVQKQKKNCTW